MAPRVSIGLPVYNGENFIEKCIDSVLAQSFEDFEFIICDNTSEDRTEEICRAYADRDSRVKYFRNEKNLGAAPNYNLCLEKASGEFFKWIAHDDWLSANYLEKCVEALDRDPSFVMAFGMPQEMVDEDTIYLDTHWTVDMWGFKGPVERFARAMRIDRLDHAIFGLFRTEPLRRTTLHRLYYGSDTTLVAEAALLGRFVGIPEAIFYNRRHQERSVAISDKLERLRWQDTSNTKKFSTEHLSRLKHVYDVSGRYPEIAPRWRILASVFTRMANPQQVMRYVAELVAMLIPNTYWRIRKFILQTIGVIKPSAKPTS
ncbi:MAG: glycosyltransferase family 2 protein [Henriciella sp.]|nr:glycosyltransferase family 2 protein [Henriciella sp.]